MKWHAQNAIETTTDPRPASVQPAPKESGEAIQRKGKKTVKPSNTLRKTIRTVGRAGSERIARGSGTTARQNSTNSAPRTKLSKEVFLSPNTVAEMASQVRTIATMVLNKTIDPETARTYSALARSVAQLVSVETQRARADKRPADLTFDPNY